MKLRDANDVAVLILILAVLALVADCIWLHVDNASREAEIVALEQRVARLENPPEEPTLSEQAKDVYDKAKDSTAKGWKRLKEAAKAGYEAARSEYAK